MPLARMPQVVTGPFTPGMLCRVGAAAMSRFSGLCGVASISGFSCCDGDAVAAGGDVVEWGEKGDLRRENILWRNLPVVESRFPLSWDMEAEPGLAETGSEVEGAFVLPILGRSSFDACQLRCPAKPWEGRKGR